MTASTTSRNKPGRRRGPSAKLQLGMAYQRVFTGHGDREDAEQVLVDLAMETRFYMVADPTTPPQVLADLNGRRAVFLRILGFLRMSEDEIVELERAARQETITSMSEGEF